MPQRGKKKEKQPQPQARPAPDVQQEADGLLCDYLQRKRLDLEAAASTVGERSALLV